MIPKSGYRFSEKIMLKQQAKAKWRFNLIPFRSACTSRLQAKAKSLPKKKDPKPIRRLGSVSCCLNSGLSDRTTGCRGMGSRPVGLDSRKIGFAHANTMQIT
jgi:hypothetical protein